MTQKKRFILLGTLTLGLLLTLGATLTTEPWRVFAKPAGREDKAPAASFTPFTYQGQLEGDSGPVDGDCEMAFRLYDTSNTDSQVGKTITQTVSVSDGLFGVTLDFGSGVFDGSSRWLGVQVLCPGDSAFTDLGRQRLDATPYSYFAHGAPWSGIDNVPGDLADGDDDTTYTAGDGLALNATQFSAHGSPYGGVVVVAKSGGDFESVQSAIDSIADAGADNPYLVWIAPGVYSETVTTKPYVHLQGAGQATTIITSTVGNPSWQPTQATLILTQATSLRDLTVGNGSTGTHNVALLATAGATQTLVIDVTARAQGYGSYSYAIYLTGSTTGVTLQHVTGLAENGSIRNYGLYNHSSAQTTAYGGSFTGRGGARGLGVFNGGGAELEAVNIIALGENGSDRTYGLSNYDGATATLTGGTFTGYGGNNARGIFNGTNGATLQATSIVASGEGGNTNLGLDNNATAIVAQSVLEGASNSVYRSGGSVTISHSRLEGGAVSGSVTCVLVSRGTGAGSVSTDGSTCP
jgi:hypothetical protein